MRLVRVERGVYETPDGSAMLRLTQFIHCQRSFALWHVTRWINDAWEPDGYVNSLREFIERESGG